MTETHSGRWCNLSENLDKDMQIWTMLRQQAKI